MTISERQRMAENWAEAYAEWERALEEVRISQSRARHYETRVQELRTQLGHTVGLNVTRRIFKLALPKSGGGQLVIVEHNASGPQLANVTLQRLEPSDV